VKAREWQEKKGGKRQRKEKKEGKKTEKKKNKISPKNVGRTSRVER
jgi:hypothetical protein